MGLESLFESAAADLQLVCVRVGEYADLITQIVFCFIVYSFCSFRNTIHVTRISSGEITSLYPPLVIVSNIL